MKILLAGDVCVDKYIYGNVNRINPEAPTPVFDVDTQIAPLEVGGMSYNVEANLKSLAPDCQIFRDSFNSNLIDLKTRYIDKKSGYIVLRTDEQIVNSHNPKSISYNQSFDAIVISDYDKREISRGNLQHYISFAKKFSIPIFIDTKKKLDEIIVEDYDGIFVKINEKEYNLTKHNLSHFDYNLIITLGEKGSRCFTSDDREIQIHSKPVEVADVCGAGDTYLAAFAIHYTKNISRPNPIENAMYYANEAAAIAVQRRGTYAVKAEELIKK